VGIHAFPAALEDVDVRHKAKHGEALHCRNSNDAKIAIMLAFHVVQEASVAAPGERTRWSGA
jgi:hypothetical protein